jgi:RNA polymerase sigma-70 factor (sigma-E family)
MSTGDPGRTGTFTSDEEPSRDESFDVLFRREYPDLLRLAYCLLGERSQAEDAVQDAFLSIYAHWHRLRDRQAAPGYLRAAVINRCRSRMRGRIRERERPPLGLAEASQASSEEAVVAHEEAGQLVTALRRLPRRQREVLVCRYFLEMSVAETAALLEISVGSVKRHAHRGIEALRVEEP